MYTNTLRCIVCVQSSMWNCRKSPLARTLMFTATSRKVLAQSNTTHENQVRQKTDRSTAVIETLNSHAFEDKTNKYSSWLRHDLINIPIVNAGQIFHQLTKTIDFLTFFCSKRAHTHTHTCPIHVSMVGFICTAVLMSEYSLELAYKNLYCWCISPFDHKKVSWNDLWT